MKILVVDPDAARAATVADAFTVSGARPAVAPSASFALTMLEWNQQEVIISRAQVGDMEGHELCSMIRADPSTVGVRFVLIANNIPPTQVSQAGIDLVIPEGLVLQAIVTRVMHLMRRAAEPGAASPSSPEPAAASTASPTQAAVVVTEPLPMTPPSAATAATPPPAMAPVSPPPPAVPPAGPTPPAASALRQPGGSAVATPPALKGAAPPPPPLTELEAVGLNGATRTFQGALGSLSLEDLAKAIAKGTKTGRLLLVLGSGGGMIAFEAGRVVHAEVGNTTGETAFQSLVAAFHRDGGGKFCFIPSAPRDLANVPKTITRPVDELLAGAAAGTNEGR